MRCFPFMSKVKSGDIISTGQYINYQSLTNLQIKKLLKNSFPSIKIDLRDSTDQQISFVSVSFTKFGLLFRKFSDNIFWFVLQTKLCSKFSWNSPFFANKATWKRFWCSCANPWENCNPFNHKTYSPSCKRSWRRFVWNHRSIAWKKG